MTTNDNSSEVNSDPFLEAMAKKKTEPLKSTSKDGPSTTEIVLFCILWVVFAGLITWGGIDMGIHVIFAVLIGVVAGFIAAVITFILGMAGIQF